MNLVEGSWIFKPNLFWGRTMLLSVAEIGRFNYLRMYWATTLSRCSHTQVLGREATVKCQESLDSKHLLQRAILFFGWRERKSTLVRMEVSASHNSDLWVAFDSIWPEWWPSGRASTSQPVASGRASASQPVVRKFEPRPSHTKDFKNGTHCLLTWRWTCENGVGS